MEANDVNQSVGQELDSLSSTRYLYNPQADSVRSIPATIFRNDTKEPNWKFMTMIIFMNIVVSLSVCLIFDYSKQINQKSEETMKSEIQDRVLHDQDQKMEVIKLGLINTLQKESFDLSKKLKNHIDARISEIYISTTMASTTSAPNPIIHVNEIEIKFSKMEENMANISRDVKICTKGVADNSLLLQKLKNDNRSDQIHIELSKMAENITNLSISLDKCAEGVVENSEKLRNMENRENLLDHFSNYTLEEKYDHLETMIESTPLIPRNCFEYGLDINGYYTINPERKPERSAKFKGFCSNGSTIIMHDHDDEVKNITYCTEKNCFNLTLNYNVDMNHIASLIEISDKCSQTITFTCYISKFSQFASWTDRNGNYHQFFTNSSINICECKKDDSCFKIQDIVEPNCNCDHSDVVQRQDEIKITNKNYLPMQSFKYGPMYNSQQEANIKIGPLICNGVKPLPTFAKDCKSLKKLGMPSGYYIIEDAKEDLKISKCSQNNSETIEPFQVSFEMESKLTLTNGNPLEFSMTKTMVKFAGSDTYISSSNFTIPKGIYEVSIVNFYSRYPVQLMLNDKSIPNTQFEIDDLHSSSLKWTIKCKAPEKNICYGSSHESGTVCIKRNSYSYQRCDRSSSYSYYKPLCDKPNCEILCKPNNSCKVQIKGIIF